MTTLTTEQKIARLKAYAERNYSRGYDTFVECYGEFEWREFLCDKSGEYDTPPKPARELSYREALAVLRRCASVYRDRQADADYYRRNA